MKKHHHKSAVVAASSALVLFGAIAFYALPANLFGMTLAPHCGNGIYEPHLGEECDPEDLDTGPNCSPQCRRYVCTPFIDPNGLVHECNTSGGGASPARCGNRIINAGEKCDDGNAVPGDGCSTTCTIEKGFGCTRPGLACARLCGNRTIDPGEKCDDGNVVSADGCSSACKPEKGYQCKQPGSLCVRKLRT